MRKLGWFEAECGTRGGGVSRWRIGLVMCGGKKRKAKAKKLKLGFENWKLWLHGLGGVWWWCASSRLSCNAMWCGTVVTSYARCELRCKFVTIG